MKDHVSRSLAEFKEFLRGYNLREIADDGEFQAELKKVFKRYYPLIVWAEIVSDVAIWQDVEKRKSFRLYLSEVASDLCFALFIALQGMYKPSLILLRSGLENFFRCILVAHNLAYDSTSVFEVIDLVKTTQLKADGDGSAHIDHLISRYGELCAYVHSADQLHMSLTKVVGVFPRYNKKQLQVVSSKLRDVCVDICSLLCLMLPDVYHRMHHSHKDVIMDVVPRGVRQHLSGIK